MTQKKIKIKINDLPSFDAAQYLDSDQAVAEYLTAILEENNAGCGRQAECAVIQPE